MTPKSATSIELMFYVALDIKVGRFGDVRLSQSLRTVLKKVT